MRQHDRIHGCQGFATTINSFTNMLRTILKKHDGVTTTGIRPQALSTLSMFLKGSNPLRNST
jgi:hypothetical protein